MRTCPKCNGQFPDNIMFCPADGTSLAAASANGAGQKPSNAPPARTTIPPLDLMGRQFFGAYKVTKLLGEGGMGAVYLAEQNTIDQKIAIKVLQTRVAGSEEIVQRFHREARVISMLTHPNIIRVFIFGQTEDGLLYLAMEYVNGRSLREEIGGKPMDEIAAIKIMKQLCSGLSEAHDLGIIHRDLKPDNVLLTDFRGERSFVKILDFGIAKLKEPDGRPQEQLTQAGIVYGTPEYLSPEQAQAQELDQRTDIYSLGVMLYELITGKVPFSASSPVQILTMHVFNPPTPPSQVLPGKVSPAMERIILKAMAKNPEDRYNQAMEMFEDLVRREMEILNERGLNARSSYVPGMELTGMYSAQQVRAALDAGLKTPQAAGSGAPYTSDNAPTLATSSISGQMAGQAGNQQLVAQGGAMAAQWQGQPAAEKSTSKIIIGLIGLAAFLLVSLLLIIAYMLVTR